MNRIINYIINNGFVSSIGMAARVTIRNSFQRKKLKNKDVSIISQNCVGGVMSHDLGLRFNSPTVNLFIRWPGYGIFLENLEYCCRQELRFVASERNYPKAVIFSPQGDEIFLYFPHEKDEERIKENWNRRKERINYDNIAVIATDRDGLTEDCIRRFEKLPYKKILLSHTPLTNCTSVQYFPRFRKLDQLPSMVEIHSVVGKRDYEYGWNYIEWLNK